MSQIISTVSTVCSKAFLVGLLVLVSLSSMGQSKSDLQRKRKELNRKIELTKKLISENQSSTQNASQELNILKQQIRFREQLIGNVQREVQNLDEKIDQLEAEILLYDDRISALKSEYAQMVERAYMNRHSHDAMLYLFSAESFTEAYKRFQLMQNYSRVRKEQTEDISRSQEEKAIAKAQLEEEKLEKEGLMSVQAEERAQLAADKKKQQRALASLEQEQEKLKQQQQEQEAERRKLNKKIEEIIAAELAAERKKNDGKFELSPEGKLISSNFEKNKGRLPWPVSRGVITQRFGKQAHPTLAGITIDPKGIDISTEKDASVLAVFGGTVSSVFNIPGAGQNVIITHGAYKTVYAGLKGVNVQKGDVVDARETIGTVLTDQGKSVIHFEIWKISSTGGTPQNPQSWIAGR